MLNCLCSAAPVSGRQSDSEADLRIFQTGGNHLRQLGDTGSGISLGPERQLFKLVNRGQFSCSVSPFKYGFLHKRSCGSCDFQLAMVNSQG